MLTESHCVTTFPGGRCGERVLHLRVSESALLLGPSQHLRLPAGWQGLVAVSEALQLQGDGVQVMPLAQGLLVKLQVFIDLSAALSEPRQRLAPWATLAVDVDTVRSEGALERWYIAQALDGGAAYQSFARVLRHGESYGLVRFLLEQGTHSEKLSDLAQRYGVSVSHFRRLCHQALGSAAKPALRGWRTARALLNMSLQDSSLTDVALELGFASSSHFSREIRTLVGFTPSSLCDITYLPGK
ncbi:helix-turn-helix domain-containing protein [Pseudomonas sp. MYb118]|uniref:helix-turn-helix domain-containing protein n=1 Tax=Pseudomonas sp. MYb118 TaxID=1848720 RepID=UPI0034CDB8B1